MVQGTTIVGKLSIGRLLLKRIAPNPVVIRSLQNWEGDGGAKASGGTVEPRYKHTLHPINWQTHPPSPELSEDPKRSQYCQHNTNKTKKIEKTKLVLI
jgi:hypothetical protein